MTKIEELKIKDLRNKNNLMFGTYFLAICIAFIITLVNQEYEKLVISIPEIMILLFGYLFFKITKKNENIFSYGAIILGFGMTIITIFLYGGSLNSAFFVLFFLVLASITFDKKLFTIGFVLGILCLILNNVIFLKDELAEGLSPAILLIYSLTGIVLNFLIKLNSKQFDMLRIYLEQAEKNNEEKENQKEYLSNNLKTIIKNITTVNEQMQINTQVNEELKIVINEISEGSQKQNDQIVQISSNAQENMESMRDVSETSKRLSTETNDAYVISENGQKELKELINEINELQEIVNDLSLVFKSLGNQIEETVNFTENINEITEKTDTLAINASIEAAKAGTAGLGFMVVADSIRKLAVLTNDTTTKITSNLMHVRKTNEDAMEKMILSQEKLNSSVNTTNDVVSYFGQLNEKIEKINRNFDKFVSLSESVYDKSYVIDNSTSDFAAIVQEASASLEEMSVVVETLNEENKKLAKNMEEIVETTKNIEKSL